MKNNGIKLCPKCKQKPKFYMSIVTGRYKIECCDAGVTHYNSKREAAMAWNEYVRGKE